MASLARHLLDNDNGEDSYEQYVEDYKMCNSLYWDPLIPRYGNDAKYLLILSALELAILFCLLLSILIKKYYILVLHDHKKAKAILLPYYDRIVYWYSFITIIRMLFAICQYIMVSSGHRKQIEHKWYIITIEGISDLGIISLESFIVFLFMQTSVGSNAFKRAQKYTLCLCIFQSILMLLRNIFAENGKLFENWSIFNVLIHGLLLITYISVFCYVCIYHENIMKMKRTRNRILYKYLFIIIIIHCIFTISYSFEAGAIDGFCFIIIAEYLYRIIFPIIAYFTIRDDSKFWKNIIYGLQFASNTSIANKEVDNFEKFGLRSPSLSNKNNNNNNNDNDDMLLSGNSNYRKQIRSIFGDEHRESHPSYYDPIIDALELEINMISYDELHDITDPFAMGSTAMVYKAKWKNQDVAVKKWIFDEIDLSLEYITEFFRETLFSNIIHPNLVQFYGACLRPPELCLVYEYVNCGDLAHLLLQKYYKKIHPRYNDAIKMKHRLKILMDITNGMTKLHDEGIIHRDLKTSNVLVQYDEQHRTYIAKVCDFGSARKLHGGMTPKPPKKSTFGGLWSSLHDDDNNNNVSLHGSNTQSMTRMTTQVGTIAFMAPELLSRIDVTKLSGGLKRPQLQSNGTSNNEYQLMTELLPKSESKKIQKRKKNNLLEIGRKWSNFSNNSTRNDKIIIGGSYPIINGISNSLNNKGGVFKSLQNKLIKNKNDDHHETNTFRFKYSVQDDEEKLDNDNNNDITTIYNKSIDIFAFGIIMYEIGFLYRIYHNMDLFMIYDTVTNNKRMNIATYHECQQSKNGFYIISQVVYESYVKLMNQCWAQTPENRPTFHEIRQKLQHIEYLRKGKKL